MSGAGFIIDRYIPFMKGPVGRISVHIAIPGPVTPAISAAFYQAEEETLIVHLTHEEVRSRFFSALESESLTLQCDKAGRLICIQIAKPRRLWIRERGIDAAPAPPVDLRFLDFRTQVPEPEYLCDSNRERVLLRWGNVYRADRYRLGDNVTVFVVGGNTLAGIYIDTIREDRAGKRLSIWRRLVAEGKSADGSTP